MLLPIRLAELALLAGATWAVLYFPVSWILRRRAPDGPSAHLASGNSKGKRWNLTDAIVAVVLFANCVVMVWFQCLPRSDPMTAEVLNRADKFGVQGSVIKVARGDRASLEEYAEAARVGTGVSAVNIIFIVGVGLYMYDRKKKNEGSEPQATDQDVT